MKNHTKLKNIPMKQLFSFFLVLSLSISTLQAQAMIEEVFIKAKEKSGFLGTGGPRYVRISLTSKNRDTQLNSDNVNSGDYYYFLIRNSGDWKLDEDFLTEILPKITIIQETRTFSVDYKSDIILEGDSTAIVVGYSKSIALHLPFLLTHTAESTPSTAQVLIPQEFWPGYSKITALTKEGETALASASHEAAVAKFEAVIGEKTLEIFPMYAENRKKRTMVIRNFFDTVLTQFYQMTEASTADTKAMKQKLAGLDEYVPKFGYVEKNAARPQIGLLASEPEIGSLISESKEILERIGFIRDSLKKTIDDLNTRWIILGSSTGRIDYKYKYIIETLVQALSSMNFQDTSRHEMKTVVSEEYTARLEKYKLTESYETFMRIVSERWKNRQPMFPPEFLENLQRDTSQFPLPLYSALKTISDFFMGDLAGTKNGVIQTLRYSYDSDLNERLDQLRVIVVMNERRIPADVLLHLKNGRLMEEEGNFEKAKEHYQDAMLIAEDFSPAAFALGKWYQRTNDDFKANNYFQKAIAKDSMYYAAYRALYMNYFKNSNFKPMIDLLSLALTTGNQTFDLHYHLGVAYNGAALYQEAIQQFELALGLNAKSVSANIQAGAAYQNIKTFTTAREYFMRAIQIDPENSSATEFLKRLDELQKKQ